VTTEQREQAAPPGPVATAARASGQAETAPRVTAQAETAPRVTALAETAPRVTALAGGVGAARMLRGLAAVVGQAAITAIINTADDIVLHGLRISPDIDTVTYTLAGAANPETGWGLDGESWGVMEALAAFKPGPGEDEEPNPLTWFALGDKDLATHLYRTGRLAAGATLSEVTTEVARRFGVQAHLLPMTDSRVETRVTVEQPGSGTKEIGFQEYFVGLRHSVPVKRLRFAGAEASSPAPGTLAAIKGADVLVICPSNPLVSIGPILSVPGIAHAVTQRRDKNVAVSPIIAGRALKGPADHMLAELGHEPSATGVARLWAPFAATLVVDEADAKLAPRIEAEGMRVVVARSVMVGPNEAAELARATLGSVLPSGWAQGATPRPALEGPLVSAP
jgi:LPPG:FO 2-phospho-L-lactate transferase